MHLLHCSSDGSHWASEGLKKRHTHTHTHTHTHISGSGGLDFVIEKTYSEEAEYVVYIQRGRVTTYSWGSYTDKQGDSSVGRSVFRS